MFFRTLSQPLSGALVLGAALGAVLSSQAVAHAQAGEYRVLNHFTVGGEGGWDYIETDAAAHRLYIAHNSSVDVVDTKTGKKIGAITGLQGTHGIVLDPDGKTGYISDGKANAIVIFDRQSMEKLASVPVGTNPDGMVYEPVTKSVWAFNGRSGDVSVLDTASRKVVATIKLPGRPEFPVADGKGFVFDNLEDKNEIVKLDANAKTVVGTYPLEGCDSPSGLAIDRKGRRLFSVCDSKIMTIASADTGKVIATVTIGDGPDADRFDAKHEVAFSPNGETGDMTIIDVHGAKPVVKQTLKTAPGARTMALDEATGDVYTVTAQFGPKPAPSPTNPRGRATPVAGSFEVIQIGR